MKRENLIILILGILLLAGMLFTIFFGGEESRHGVGSLRDTPPGDLSGKSCLLPGSSARAWIS